MRRNAKKRRGVEKELQEEQAWRDVEMCKQEEQLKEQFGLLHGLVQEYRVQETEVKNMKLREYDDVKVYLTTLERVMRSYEIPQEDEASS